MHSGTTRPHSETLAATVAAQIGDELEYALEGSIFMGGAVVQWIVEGLKLADSPAAAQALAESVPDSNGVVFVPALTGLGAPEWDPLARGAIFGLTRGATDAHVARAAMEAIPLQVGDLMVAMERRRRARARVRACRRRRHRELAGDADARQRAGAARSKSRSSPSRPRWARRISPDSRSECGADRRTCRC